jgi:DNA-binding MarR family transcriptional regulator
MSNLNGIPEAKWPAGASGKPRRRGSNILPQKSVASVINEWHHARPELDLGPLGLFAALAHVYWLTTPEIERLMARHSLTRGMFDVLTTLRRVGPPCTLAPKQLSQSLLLSGAGITNRLDRLEALKLIQRLPDPQDRRGLKIKLTNSGLRLVDRILPQLIKLERRMVAGLANKDTTKLTDLLDEFAQSLQTNAIRDHEK